MCRGASNFLWEWSPIHLLHLRPIALWNFARYLGGLQCGRFVFSREDRILIYIFFGWIFSVQCRQVFLRRFFCNELLTNLCKKKLFVQYKTAVMVSWELRNIKCCRLFRVHNPFFLTPNLSQTASFSFGFMLSINFKGVARLHRFSYSKNLTFVC